MATTAYPNPKKFSSAKNLSAFTLCLNRVNGRVCHALIPFNRRLCADCLHRAHAIFCPSPREECTCGFSKLFWADLAADLSASKVSGPVVRVAKGGDWKPHHTRHGHPGREVAFLPHAGCKEFPGGVGVKPPRSGEPKSLFPGRIFGVVFRVLFLLFVTLWR
jgi:hypothetical protein